MTFSPLSTTGNTSHLVNIINYPQNFTTAECSQTGPEACHNQLTTTPPNAGSLSAFRTGTLLHSRHESVLSPRAAEAACNPAFEKLKFWASDSFRVFETAKYFAHGLHGLNWRRDWMTLHIIPETADQGSDTLTPSITCTHYRDDTEKGHDYGYHQLWKFRDTYLPAIADRLDRLHAQNPAFEFFNADVYSMQEICGFEMLARGGDGLNGDSSWCLVFTKEDWLNFEYARDVLHYYRAGPGNPYSAAMGSLWVETLAGGRFSVLFTIAMYYLFSHSWTCFQRASMDIYPLLIGMMEGDGRRVNWYQWLGG